MVTKIKQSDPEWGGKRIGSSQTTIARDGCTICSMCMALEKLRGYFANPIGAAFHWAFNWRGEILWKESVFKGMKFILRGYNADIGKIRDYANDPEKAAIIQVQHRTKHYKHWLYVQKVHGVSVRVIDPIDGEAYDNLPEKYEITGYALFVKDVKIPKWMVKFVEAAKAKGLDVEDALEDMSVRRLEEVLFDLGIIKEKTGHISLGRWLVIIDKIKEWAISEGY